MVQIPLDKENAPPTLNIHIVFQNDVYGSQKVLGVFRQFNQAQEFIEQTFPLAPRRRVMGLTVYDVADGETVEIETWAVT